jgi:tetratricopeptide (TPR) repeat protein
MTTEIDRGALEDQRDFLLRSLEDLEREHEAGDVDEHDYAALKDDYTARAASVLRALDADQAKVTVPEAARSLRRTAVVALGVGAFALVAGLLVAHVSGRRDPGETATGGVRQSTTEALNAALQAGNEGAFTRAVELYQKVLTTDPDNVEALAYGGWMRFLAGDVQAGFTQLLKAGTTDVTYPDVHAFLAVAFFRLGHPVEAGKELDRLDALDPPAAIRDLTAGLRTQIDAAIAASTTTSTTT